MPPERLWGKEEDAYSEIYMPWSRHVFLPLRGKLCFDAKDVESLASKHVAKIRLSSAKKLQGVEPGLSKIHDPDDSAGFYGALFLFPPFWRQNFTSVSDSYRRCRQHSRLDSRP